MHLKNYSNSSKITSVLIGFIKRGTIYIDDKIDKKHMGFELNLK